jgi:methionine sulfoxide reductase heme-binding subunit
MMPTAAVATATSPLWFASPAWPRFVTVGLHRSLSLLTITFTGLHVLTTITDPFASISVVSVVIPFTSGYRRIWPARRVPR